MLQRVKSEWEKDRLRGWLFVGGFAYAWIVSQGIPLWDDDFTSWFWKIKDHSIWRYFFEWISPISTQPQFWGFNERPLQSIIYKLCYLISGYESWSYFLYKSIVFSGIGVMIYQWGLMLAPAGRWQRVAALAAAVFFMVAPGPMAAHILHQDLAPTAELIFLALAYVIWQEIEKTPLDWKRLPSVSDPAGKAWLIRWAVIAFATYLGYKSKADLKLIPVILLAYLLFVRRHQLRLFAFPLAIMAILAVPWGPGILTKLPPFIPGSHGSEIGWMWQPASFDRMMDFIWSSSEYHFLPSLREPTISLGGLLGPFLLLGIAVFLGWRAEALDQVPWTRRTETTDRARFFALIWFAAILAGTSALPALNISFRIRYGILTLVPASLLLAWIFGLFGDSARRIPKWAAIIGVALFLFQTAMNLNRSIVYRRDMGAVMVAVDQVYEKVNRDFSGMKLALYPDFRPYDYRPDATALFRAKKWLQKPDDLATHYKPLEALAISWNPSLWEQVELVGHFSGCRSTTLFDHLFPCTDSSGAYLMRFIGKDPLYAEAEKLRAKGDLAGASALFDQFLAKYPGSLVGHFLSGLVAYQRKDFARSEADYALLEKYFPGHLGIVYNHGIALAELKRYGEATRRLQFVVDHDPKNYAALINLYHAYAGGGEKASARKVLDAMRVYFPGDNEVNRLLAESS